MADDPQHRGGFLASGNVWVLIPLAGISIPILAVVGETPLVWVVAVLAVIGAVTASARYLMEARHRLKLQEIAAQERVAIAERDRFTAVERMLEREGLPPEGRAGGF